MNLRDIVINEDILEAYMVTKEILQQNFIFNLLQKKDQIQKSKKNKHTYVMEKIRQFCEENNTKIFSLNDIRQICEAIGMKDDLERIIETLNFNTFMIKVGSNEYQLN